MTPKTTKTPGTPNKTKKIRPITPNNNDKELTAFSKHFVLPPTQDSNKKSSITPSTQKQTPNKQSNDSLNSNKTVENIRVLQQQHEKPIKEQFKAGEGPIKEGPDLQNIEFNAQVIANSFPENDDVWNFKWLPKSPTNIWHEGPHRYSIDQDLQEFDSEVDIYMDYGKEVYPTLSTKFLKESINQPKKDTHKKINMERAIPKLDNI